MRIKEESIRRLQESISIIDVISDYVQLRKRGKNFVGLCPFHSEKTPSFTANEEKGLYHCFGCGEGGNAVSFLMKLEKYTFVDAIENLAKKFNFQLEYEDSRYYEKDTELEKLYDYSRLIAHYYYENLTKTNEGENILKYLAKRGINEQTIKTFELGYSLSSWEGLLTFIEKKSLDINLVEKLGLLVKRDDGSYYDRFRGRLIFPIFSPAGRVIAFGGRILTETDDQPKYVNSPETKIYIKGKNLYGLFQAKDEIRKKDFVILVEGYMDAISLFQNGFQNVVASSGTALTEEQVQVLARYTKNFVLIYDSDEAGKKAAVRASEIILDSGVDLKIVSLPEGEDPDSFVKKHGEKRTKIEIDSAQNYIDFVANTLTMQKEQLDTTDKAEVITKIIELTAKVQDPIKRSLYVKNISEKFKIRESAVLEALDKITKQVEKLHRTPQDTSKAEKVAEKPESKVPATEKYLIKLLFEEDKKLCDFIFFHVQPEDFQNEKIRILAKIIKDVFDEGIIPRGYEIINLIEDDDLKNLLSEIIFDKYKISPKWEDSSNIVSDDDLIWDSAEDYIKRFKIEYLERQIALNQTKLKSAVDFEEIKKLIELDKSLKEEIIRIQNTKYRE
ncbi:MAG: DNA primase [Ignavibacteria bacterium]|nr:DNA primase [Ignavibacteria bacterium]